MKTLARPELSIIIVNHNAKDFLLELLASIATQVGVSIETIVVDNHSSDASRSVVMKQFPDVIWIERQTSHGFAAGNNLGIKKAQGEVLLFLNPDTKLLQPTDLKRCYDKLMFDPTVGALTCRLDLALSGRIDETCHRGFPTPWAALTYFSGLARLFPDSSVFGEYLQSYKGYTTEHEVDAVGGMFLLIRRSVGEQVGWWDEDYVFYGEDIDFCYRLKAAGYRNLYYPAVTALHYKGVSSGMSQHSKAVTTASRATTRQVKSWSINAMEIFYRKHYAKKYPLLLTWLVYLGIRLMRLKRLTLA